MHVSTPSGTAPAIDRSRFLIAAFLFIAVTATVAGCARRFPATEVTAIKAGDADDLERYLLARKPDVAEFRSRGPFAVDERKDVAVRVASDLTITADFYVCAAGRKAPLVVVLHGQDNSKDDHGFQARHLASWGMNSLALNLPNRGPWIANGLTLAKLVAAVHRNPALVDARVDPNRIILAGHSFGATAVATALGEGAAAVGGVLLDPAAIGRQLPQLLKQIAVPVMIVGADENIRPTR